MMNHFILLNFKKIFSILDWKEKKKFFFLSILILLISIFEVMSIGMVFPLVSFLIDENNISKFKNLFELYNFNNEEIIRLTILFISAIFIAKFILTIFFQIRQNRIIFQLMHSLLKKIYTKYLYQPYSFFLNKNTSHLISNLSTQVPDVIYNFVMPMMLLFSEILILAFIVILLVIVDYKTILIASIVGFISFLFLRMVSNQIKSLGATRVFNEKKKIENIQQSLLAIKETILFDRQNYFVNKFNKFSFATTTILSKYFSFLELPKILLELIGFIFLIMLIFFFYYLGYDGREILPLIVIFSLAAYKILPSANRIINSIQRMRFTTGAIDSVYYEIRNSKNSIVYNKKNNLKPLQFNNFINIKNIFFKYQGSSRFILKNFNLKINKGEILGIYGKSGSGKTTLINILLGLLEPSKGVVLIDNIDIKKNTKGWQKNIGYVPQIIHLLNSSIKENINLGFFDKNNITIKASLQLSQLDNFVKNLKNKEKTTIGEDGVKISGGQRQRLGIARAIYRNPEVLILDEPTSSLDNETEQSFIKTIISMKRKKTIIIVSHKDSVLKKCDRIIKL
jgi:ABC-type bacteriocin/lantibiotic exporter with double-glycine peptidase domain